MSAAPSASTILRDHVPFVVPFVPSSVFSGSRPESVKRAPCRARFSARSRPEVSSSGARRVPRRAGPIFRRLAASDPPFAVRRRATWSPRSSVANLSSSSCAPVFTVVSDGAFRLAEEAPAVALASGASLPPPSCDVLSDIVVDGHREVPVRAGKPAREGVVFEGTFAGDFGRPGSSARHQVGT